MINWELNFSTPYAQKLVNGEIGSARVHARVLTDQYMSAIRLGAPVGIPPTLPSGIAPAFPTVPVGPGTYFNLYETRRMLFENTIYSYFQAKAILDGKANVNDAIVSLKRLQKKAKELSDEVKTTAAELKVITQEIQNLPQEFVEFYNDIKSIIEAKLQQLKDLQINAKDPEYVKEQKRQLLQALFGEEITTINAILEFKPSLNPADYENIVNLATTIEQELKKINKITSSEEEFKKYLLKEAQRSLKFVLGLVPGFLDPTELLVILADAAANVVSTTPLTKKAYYTLLSLLKKTKYLRGLELRLKSYLVEKRKKLNYYVHNKIKKLKKWINNELQGLAKRVADYQARLEKTKFIKNVREDVKKAKVKIAKTKLRIQIAKDLSQQIKDIIKEVQGLVVLAKEKWSELLTLIDRIVNLNDTVTAVEDSIIAAASEYKENAKQKYESEIQKLKTITPQQGYELSVSLLGKSLSIFEIFIEGSQINLTKEIKKIVKRKVNEINLEYRVLLQTILTTIIKAQTLKKLIAFDQTLKIHSGDVRTIQRLYTTKVSELKEAEVNQIKYDVLESSRVQKPTFKDLVMVLDELATLVNSNLKMSQQDIENEAKTLQEETKKALESSKFLKSLQKKNAKIQKLFDNKLKTEQELREKQAKLEKQRRLVKKGRLAVSMGTAVGTISANFANGTYLLSDNEQPLQKFIKSYYDYKLLDHRITKAAYNTDLKNTKDKIETIKKYELFAVLLVELFKDLQTGNFIEEFQSAISSLTANVKVNPINGAASLFLNRMLDLLKSGTITAKKITNLITDATVDTLNSILSFTDLIAVESKYTKRILALISAYENLPNSQGINIKDEKLAMFYNDVIDTGSVLITCIKYAKKYVIEPSIAFIKKTVKQQIDDIKKKQQENIKKFKKYVDKQKQKLKDKLVNPDAKIMSIMLGTAARLFWTGATWTNPAGTTFLVLSIGPFVPIKALPKDGADGIARQIGDGFNNQLAFMTGLAIPNPATLIPPFPFNGYI